MFFLVDLINNVSISGKGLPCGSLVKNPPANSGDTGSIPGSGRCPGKGNGNPVQHSCLGNLMDRGAWQTMVHGVTKESVRLNNIRGENKMAEEQVDMEYISLHG